MTPYRRADQRPRRRLRVAPILDLDPEDIEWVRRALRDGTLPTDVADEAQRLLESMATDVVDESGDEERLGPFSRAAWSIIEPATVYKHNWHLDCIDDHLEAVTRGDIRNLVINMPPRHEKSIKVSVMWPAWVWTFNPSWRWLFASYSHDLSIRDSVSTRRIIQSRWYQERWGRVFQLTGDQNAKTRFDTNKAGVRLATSVGGIGAGEGGDAVVVDDPHNVLETESDQSREGVLQWWDQQMSTRLNDPKKGRKVIVMQRLHERDLSGHVLAAGGYVHLRLPTEYTPKVWVRVPGEYMPEPDPVPVPDPRTVPGELLWTEHFGPAEVADAKVRLGEYGFAGQHQQDPAPASGGIFKEHWWRFWQPADRNYGPVPVTVIDQQTGTPKVQMIYPVTLPALEFVGQSWDMSFKDLKSSDWVCGQTWGRWKANAYLLEQMLEQADIVRTLEMVAELSGYLKDFTARNPTPMFPFGARATAKWVEDKANGPAVMSMLRTKVPGLIAVNPDGDKVARARSVAPYANAGNVFLPHPDYAPWVRRLIALLNRFPKAQDDPVDALTQALRKLLLFADIKPTGEYAVAGARFG